MKPFVNYALEGFDPDDGLDETSLRSAIQRAYYEHPLFAITVDERRRQREAVSDAHAAVYRDLLR